MGILWQEIWGAITRNFSDLHGLANGLQVAFRLVLAVGLGGLLGYERTLRRRPAGLRTHMLVSLGAAAYVLVPEQADMKVGDLSRVIQGLTTGIGFLGAGAILKDDDTHQTRGLTTAAGIWLTAAVGMAVGMGRLATGVLIALLALVILSPFLWIEERIMADGQAGSAPPS
jgi:putative Mg2+ transporter-C (MgtC) family protein